MMVATAAEPARESVVFLEGLLASIALATLVGSGFDATGAFGLAVAVFLAWQSRAFYAVAQFAAGGVGIAASIPALAAYLGEGCVSAIPLWGRVLVLIAVAFVGGFGLLHSVFLGGLFTEFGKIGLGWFGLVELLTFMSTTAILSFTGVGRAFVVGGAVVLGGLIGWKPRYSMWTIGTGMALITLAGGAIIGTPAAEGLECHQLVDATGAAMIYLVSFLPIAVVWLTLRGIFRAVN